MTFLIKEETGTGEAEPVERDKVIVDEGVPDDHLSLGVPLVGPELGQPFGEPEGRCAVGLDVVHPEDVADLVVHENVHQLMADDPFELEG